MSLSPEPHSLGTSSSHDHRGPLAAGLNQHHLTMLGLGGVIGAAVVLVAAGLRELRASRANGNG
ncbi:hypothetical protein [Kitasatospora sp. NPDC094011]|uniref:hypothetical protein n=1 Tax=Kitasatospora sp. NPDC094011 TaxID=3364090 RepID=UPI00382E1BF0